MNTFPLPKPTPDQQAHLQRIKDETERPIDPNLTIGGPRAVEKLLPCPHCGHHAYEPERVHGENWGDWDWVIMCSSSHCRARVQIIADGWSEGARNRLTQLRAKWNRRVVAEKVDEQRTVQKQES